MTILKSILKWIGLSIGSLLILLILAGLTCRTFGAKPTPTGKLVDVGGFKLHINSTGEKNNKPTLVIESGAGAPGEYYHWLSEGLKDSIRVVRYDRAGIGYSELGNTPRHPETAARDLHKLLELAGESPPYIMAGHSYGGHYIRIFTKLYPEEVAGMVFLDSSHPEARERLNLPEKPWFLSFIYKAGVVLADLGLLNLYERTSQSILWAPGLPAEVNNRMRDYSVNGNYIRGYLKGDNKWGPTLNKMSSEANDFGSLPIQVFSGTHLNKEALRRMGLNPDEVEAQRESMQQEIANLSTKGELFFLDGGHVTIFSEKENADFICKKIIDLLAELEIG